MFLVICFLTLLICYNINYLLEVVNSFKKYLVPTFWIPPPFPGLPAWPKLPRRRERVPEGVLRPRGLQLFLVRRIRQPLHQVRGVCGVDRGQRGGRRLRTRTWGIRHEKRGKAKRKQKPRLK